MSTESLPVLQAGNVELRQRLCALAQRQRESMKIVLEQALSLAELKRENAEMRERIASTESMIDNMQLKNAVSHFSAALGDLMKTDENIFAQLPVSAQPDAAQLMKAKRMSNCLCYYMHSDEAEEAKRYKRCVLRERLRGMPRSVRELFARMYPGVVEAIEVFLDTHTAPLMEVSDCMKEEVNFWWM